MEIFCFVSQKNKMKNVSFFFDRFHNHFHCMLASQMNTRFVVVEEQSKKRLKSCE